MMLPGSFNLLLEVLSNASVYGKKLITIATAVVPIQVVISP